MEQKKDSKENYLLDKLMAVFGIELIPFSKQYFGPRG